MKVKVCRYCGWWWWNQVHPGEGHDKAELYLQPSLSHPILCRGCLEAWRGLIWSFPLPGAPHAEFVPCPDTDVCEELLKNTDETLPYKGSKRCLHSLNYLSAWVFDPWYWNKTWKCIAGQGWNHAHLHLGVLSYRSLKRWSHHSFMLALCHFFTKLVQQTKSAEK